MAFTDGAFHADLATMRLDNAIAHREPQAGAFANLFGGKERVKNALQIGLWNATTVVAHRNLYRLQIIRVTGSD